MEKFKSQAGKLKWIYALGLLIIMWATFGNIKVSSTGSCPQVEPYKPPFAPIDKRLEYLGSDSFLQDSLPRFAGAIQIPTVSYDSMRGEGVIVDPALHAPFLKLHSHLEKSYPLLHSTLEKHVINDYSLLYVWKGANPSLKPIMFMAHQDVVPVDPATISEWIHEPFSGVVSDGKIWGRGASDTKLTLISILEAVEALVGIAYQPERTILVSFGHDEEISGYNGIKQIVKFVQNNLKIPANGIEFILDEGMSLSSLKSPVVKSKKEYLVAQVGVSEKGYVDVNITVTMKKGGHASIAPPHTGIGILSQIITKLEANPFQPDLRRDNPILDYCNCIAEHTDIFTEYQKYLVDKWEWFKPLLLQFFATEPILKAATTTSQAVDVIHGGVKVNALPQFQYALMNMRVAPHESIQIVADRIKSLVEPIATQNNLDLFTEIHAHHKPESSGAIYLSFNDALEPSPVSPKTSYSFIRLSGVIKHIFGSETIVTPTIMTANTDTKFVWELTENIFRFMPYIMDGTEGIHTVNENTKLESFTNTVRFYHELIRSFDE